MKSKVISLLLSFVIAFGLWVYVITVVNPDSKITIRNIPVELEGEKILHENGLMVIKNETPTIDLQLEGNRSDLIKLNKSNITVTVDVTKIDSEGIMNAAYTIRYPGDIPDNAVTVHSQDPGMVRLVVEKRVTKYVDVAIKYVGTLPDRYVIWKDKAELDVDKIPIVGPKSVVDTVKQAVVTVDLSNQKNTIDKDIDFVLCDANGQAVITDTLSYDVTSVRVTVPIDWSKVISLPEPKIEYGFGATSDNTTVDYTKSITIYGSKSVLEGIGANSVSLSGTFVIEQEDLSKDKIVFSDVKLKGLPHGVTTDSNALFVTVDVSQVATDDISIRLDSVKWDPADRNCPKGYYLKCDESSITVTVRGAANLLSQLDSSDFVVIVTTNDITESTKMISVMIETTGEANDAGIYVCEYPDELQVSIEPINKA